MLRIFETGDNHIGLKYADHEQAQTLVDNRIDSFEKMVSMANKENCDLFCITGDLFEKTYAAKKDVKKIIDLLSAFNGTVVVLPGNHDYYDPDVQVWQYFTDLTKDKDNFILLKEYRPYVFSEGDKEIVFYPALCTSLHSQPGENNLGWIKEQKIVPDHTFRIGMAHGAVAGETIDSEGSYFLMSRKELNSIPVDVWLIGHTHVPSPSVLPADSYEKTDERIFNAGTHVQTDVSNNTEGDCFIIEIEDGNGQKSIRAKKFVSGTIRFFRKNVKVTPGSLKESILNATSDLKDQSVVDLIINGTASDEEYAERDNIIDKCLSRFIEGTFNTHNLSRQITEKMIDEEFPETSFTSGFLKELLVDPNEVQMAYDLVKTIRR